MVSIAFIFTVLMNTDKENTSIEWDRIIDIYTCQLDMCSTYAWR